MTMKISLALATAVLAGYAAACLCARTLSTGKGDPPGLAPVPAGKVVVGTPREGIQAILDRTPPFLGPFTAECPPETVDVPAFWIQVNEVTNEQYEAFVRATKRRPPVQWFKGDLRALGRDWLAKNPGKIWDPNAWWDIEWEKHPWEVPADLARVPVVNVSFHEAEAYARWVGLRLPSREEFLRAGRGDSSKTYPWGAKWEPSLCANYDTVSKRQGERVLPRMGTHPGGKAPSGAYDLVGSVWEWTTSRDVEPNGYKPFEIKRSGQPPETVRERFDASKRLVVGGSFLVPLPDIVCRLATRNGLNPAIRLEDIGFRCARSERAGVDVARWCVEKELNLSSLGDVTIDPARVLVFERWEAGTDSAVEASGSGKSGIALAGTRARASVAEEVAGYAVIRKYEAILLAPVAALPFLTPTELERASRDQPQPLALLYTDRPLVAPSLPPGLYTISYRHEGAVKLASAKPKEEAPKDEKKPEEPADPQGDAQPTGPSLDEILSKWIDPKKRALVFRDRLGEIVAAMETADDVELKDVRAGSEIGAATPDPEEDTIRFLFPVLYKLGEKKGFQIPVTLKFDAGTCSLPWNG
jgi:formylglycine-generating enzyme required for sulfatase activity